MRIWMMKSRSMTSSEGEETYVRVDELHSGPMVGGITWLKRLFKGADVQVLLPGCIFCETTAVDEDGPQDELYHQQLAPPTPTHPSMRKNRATGSESPMRYPMVSLGIPFVGRATYSERLRPLIQV